MGTRYVWGKYAKNADYAEIVETDSFYSGIKENREVYFANSYTKSAGKFVLENPESLYMPTQMGSDYSQGKSADEFPYVIPEGPSGTRMFRSKQTGCFWGLTHNDYNTFSIWLSSFDPETYEKYSHEFEIVTLASTPTYSKGSALGTVSGPSNGHYPWYPERAGKPINRSINGRRRAA